MEVGSAICLTMIVGIFTPHVATGCLWLYRQAIAFKDRGYSCNRKYTRQIIQEDYEEIYTGEEFLLEFRYSQLVTTIYIVMMFSVGMPLLYPIAFISFFVTYWFDKVMSKLFGLNMIPI